MDFYTGIEIGIKSRCGDVNAVMLTGMVRVPLTAYERERGERLGQLLRAARAGRSMVEVASVAGVSVETLRKIETGRIATPAFFTVAAIADAVDLPLEHLRQAVGAGAEPAVVPPVSA